MSLSKYEKEHIALAGGIAVIATAIGMYAYMKQSEAGDAPAELDEPIKEKLLAAQAMPITIKTKFQEKRLQSLSHDSNLT